MYKIAILFTVHNRCNITIAGLYALYDAIDEVQKKFSFDLYMTDDGCTDDTVSKVKSLFPNIVIIKGNGSLYWSGGMRLAWDVAKSRNDYDYYLWYNDDAVLFKDAIKTLLDASLELGDNTIISGAFYNAETGIISYGGWSKKYSLIALNPLKFEPVYFMNGNLVLITKKVFEQLGNIDEHYIHSLGDWDYSGRARKKGISVVLTKNYVGTTSRHDKLICDAYNCNLSIFNRLKLLYSPFYHPKVRWHFKRIHFGLFSALVAIVACHFYVLFPFFAKKNKVVD